jgi:PAS domain-containing protein
MPDVTIQTPDWLRQMESILEELNEGVIIVDSQLRVVFANEALIRVGGYERGTCGVVRLRGFFRQKISHTL